MALSLIGAPTYRDDKTNLCSLVVLLARRTRRRMRLWVAALIVGPLVLSASPRTLTATESLTMAVSPTEAFAPATLRIQLRIAPNTKNRELELIADSGDFYRRSCVALDGEAAPRVLSMQFDGMPGGEYELRSVLIDADGHVRAVVRQTVIVISGSAP